MADDLPKVGAEVILDVDSYNKSIDDAISRADELDSALNELGGTVNANIDVDSSALTDLEDTQVDVGITVDDSELPFDDIPPETTTEVKLTEDADAKSVAEDMHFMANLKRIETVINVAGNVLDVVEKIGGMVVDPFLDVEDAVAKINAQTGSGTGIDDLGAFIRGIQAADLSDSVDQISNVVIAAQQLHAPIEEATTASLTFTKVFKDQDPVTTMKSLKSLSDEFGISMTEAANLMTVFFQNGGNKAGDALATVDKYSQSWKDMGLTIPQALSSVQSLMAGGVDSADAAAKMVQNFDDAATKAAADPNSAEAKMLNMMGIDNPKDQGQAIGAKTIDGFVAAFNNLPANQQDLASGLFFGKTGKLDTSAIGGLTTESDMFKNVTDAAAAAATEIDNSLRGAINDFVTEINAKVGELLSSDAIDLPGKIAALKKGLQDGVSVLANGGTVGDALEVALNIPGLSKTLDTFIGNFERIVGNIEIAFLQVVASIQDITGHGKEAAGTRAQIVDLSKKQLAFDLQLGNPDEIATQVNQAIGRGVTDLGGPIDTALAETLKTANFDQGSNILQGLIDGAIANGASPDAANKLAATYVTNLSNGFDNALAAGDLNLLQKMIAIKPNEKIPGLDEAVAGFQKQLSDAFIPQDRSGGTAGTSPFSNMGAMFPPVGKTGATGGGLLGGLVTDANNAITGITNAQTAVTGFETSTKTSTDNVATNWNNLNVSLDDSVGQTITHIDNAAAKVEEFDTRAADAIINHSIVDSFDAMLASAEANFPPIDALIDGTSGRIQQLDLYSAAAAGSMAGLMAGVKAFPVAKLEQIVTLATGFAGAQNIVNDHSTTNTNVTVNNNNSNGAQTSNSQYQLSQTLGGG